MYCGCVQAMVMGNCVRRSNALLKYGSSIIYQESEVYASGFAGFVSFVNLILFGTVLGCTPLREIAIRTLLPAPGQGPSEAFMDKSFLKITGFCTGDQVGISCFLFVL